MTHVLLVALLLLVGCGREETTPEQQVTAMLDQLDDAASARDLGTTLDLLSDDYGDAAGRDKQDLKAVVLQYYMGHEAIHVLKRIRSIEVADPPDAARVVVVAALTGAPVSDPGQLETISADVYRFEMVVAREDDGQWRIRSARWKRGDVSSFF